MRLKYLTCLAILFGLFPGIPSAEGQVNLLKRHSKVKQTPTNSNYKLEDEEIVLEQGFFPQKELWIVLSDRESNTTYARPGSEMQLRSLSFLEVCYVIRRKGDYLELIKYNPKLLKNPRKGAVDIKNADYLGWIHKSQLLLWRTALKDHLTGYDVKGLTCFKNENAISLTAPFTIDDSLILFSDPEIKKQTGACGMKNLFYIFKQSEDGSHYLVGRLPQVTPENRFAAISGWISKDLIMVWGMHSFFMQDDRKKQPLAASKIAGNRPFFASAMQHADTIPGYQAYSCSEGKAPGLLARIFPVQEETIGVDGRKMIKTCRLLDPLDRRENKVTNINGAEIPFNEFRCLISRQHRLNIVFVADGGSERSLSTVRSLLQQMEQTFDTAGMFTSYKFGAVVYKDNAAGRCNVAPLPLGSRYADLGPYFYNRLQELNNCNDNLPEQAVFSGLAKAARMLKPHKDESNIIVLVGAAGNPKSASDFQDIISQVSKVNARLLIFQTHGGAGSAYNNYFTTGKALIEQTGIRISENKKAKLIDLVDAVKNPDFSLTRGDSGVYSLDYPANSMTQGFLIIPDKGQTMKSSFLINGLNSLMLQIFDENLRMERSLKRYFNSSSAQNTCILEPYRRLFPNYGHNSLPVPFLTQAFRLSEQPFCRQAWIENVRPGDSAAGIKFGLFVSEKELETVIQALEGLGGAGNLDTRNRRTIYSHLRREGKQYLRSRPVGEHISRVSLAGLLEYSTGYKSMNPIWRQHELRMIKRPRLMDRSDILSFLTACREKADGLTENKRIASSRFYNNGQVFYWLPAEQLP